MMENNISVIALRKTTNWKTRLILVSIILSIGLLFYSVSLFIHKNLFNNYLFWISILCLVLIHLVEKKVVLFEDIGKLVFHEHYISLIKGNDSSDKFYIGTYTNITIKLNDFENQINRVIGSIFHSSGNTNYIEFETMERKFKINFKIKSEQDLFNIKYILNNLYQNKVNVKFLLD